jgi:hypothetical protein
VKPEGKEVARRSAFIIEPTTHNEAWLLVRQYHYSKSCGNTGAAWRAADHFGNTVAVAIFLPPMNSVGRQMERLAKERGHRCTWDRVTGLHRLVVLPGQPQNVASMLVCAALRELRRSKKWDAVVTYADLSVGHTGQVYRAMNAEYLGVAKPKEYWLDANGVRCMRKAERQSTAQMRELGFTQHLSQGKHKFVWWLNKGRAAKEGEE